MTSFRPLEGRGQGTLSARAAVTSPIEFSARDYFVQVTSSNPNDGSYFFQINEVDSVLGVSVPADTTGEFEDTTSVALIEVGDLVSHRLTNPGGVRTMGLLQTDPVPFVPTEGRAFFFWF